MTSLSNTFAGASSFVGTGLSMWNVENVQSLLFTFNSAAAFNADLSRWNVQNVQLAQSTFQGELFVFASNSLHSHIFQTKTGAVLFTGEGLSSWFIRADAAIYPLFKVTPSLPDCTKREIYNKWAPQNPSFAYNNQDLQNLTCPCAMASSVYLVVEVLEGCVPTVEQPCEVACPALHQSSTNESNSKSGHGSVKRFVEEGTNRNQESGT